MADLQKVKIGTTYYNLKDAKAREDIATNAAAIEAEVSRATGAESGLDTRITALESKGRYLSTWNATTGKPDTYPEISQLKEGKYNYRSGDYYIVNKVATSGNLMPDGAYISYDSATTTWTVPTKAFSGSTLNLGDQFQYDGTKWTYIASATTVAFANIQGDAEDNDNLRGKLDAKFDVASAGAFASVDVAYGQGLLETIDTIEFETSYIISTATLSIYESAAALTYSPFTPTGTVSGTVTPTGTVDVTLADSTVTSPAEISYSYYTPAGTIEVPIGGSAEALTQATFAEVSAETSGAVQIKGTNSKPNVNITANETSAITSVSYSVTLPTFTEGAFTSATWTGSSYTAPTWTGSSYTAPTLGTATTGAFAFEGVTVSVNTSAASTSDDYECLIFTTAGTSSAVTAQGTFSAGDVTFGTFGAGSLAFGTFSGGSKAADTFTSGSTTISTSTSKVLNANTTAALDAAPAFTGSYYSNNILTDNVLKEVNFVGTSAEIVASGVYYTKQVVSNTVFSGDTVDIDAAFTGSETENVIVNNVPYLAASDTVEFSFVYTPIVSKYNSTSKQILTTVTTTFGE